MNNRLLLGRSLRIDNMRIVRSVAAFLFEFTFIFLRELGVLSLFACFIFFPCFLLVIVIPFDSLFSFFLGL